MKKKEKTNDLLILELNKLKERVKELEVLENKYINMIQTIPDIIYEIDENGKFVFVSDIIKYLGYEPSDLIGKHFKEIIHPKDFKLISRDTVLPKLKGKKTGDIQAPKLFDERRAGRRTTKSLIVRVASKKELDNENEYKLAEVFSSGVWSTYLNDFPSKYFYTEIYSIGKWEKEKNEENSKFLGTIGVIRDITVRKKAEEELLKAKKFESLTVLAKGIAHDFNNVLTSIIANIFHAKECIDEESEAVEYLENLENASHVAKNLIKQLLKFSSKAELQKKIVKIDKLIKEVADFTLTGHNIKCTYDVEKNIYNIEVDPAQISQVLNNILINAVQSMNDRDGNINIKIENLIVKEIDRLPIPNGNYVKVSIKDNGNGIPEDILSKIFDPYFTTKVEGKGLGLSTCFSILKQHDAYIDVDSKIDHGTNFYIYFRAIEE